MSNGLDMSLDDLIKQSKSKPKASSAFSSGPTRRAPPPARAMPYPPVAPKTAAAADSPYGAYSEHVAAMAASSPPSVLAAPRVLETGTKLHISNLNPSVTVEDVQELFSEVGELKRYSVNYDKDGKSQGSAEVVFVRKVDALDAIERYNGVLLDGNPMQIELVGTCPKEVAREDHFTVMVVLGAVVAKEEFFQATVVLETLARDLVAGGRLEREGMIGTVCRRLLQILMLSWRSIMQQQGSRNEVLMLYWWDGAETASH